MSIKSTLSILAGLVLLALMIAPLQLAWAGTAPPTEWEKTFGGTSNDVAYAVQQTADGGYVLAGYTDSYGAGNHDAWLIKTDSSGNKTWDKTFGGLQNDYAWSVQQTSDGGYVLAGWTTSYGAGGYDAWLIKVASEAPPPTVTSISPTFGVAGGTVNVTNLAGIGFQAGASVRLELGSTVVNATKVNVVSDTQITCQLVLPGTLGKYDVVVTNPDGQEATLTGGFKVTNACGGGAAVSLSLFGVLMGLMSLAGSAGLRRRFRRSKR